MDFDFYKIINLDDFDAKQVVSTSIDLFLEERGDTSFLITKGNTYGLTVDDVFLPVEFAGKNPFVFGNYAIFLTENRNVYFGYGIS